MICIYKECYYLIIQCLEQIDILDHVGQFYLQISVQHVPTIHILRDIGTLIVS